MVGLVQRDKALGMLGCQEKTLGVRDPDGAIQGGVEEKQRLVQLGEGPLEVILREVVEELLPDAEGASSSEVDLGFSPGFELGREADQGVAQVLGVARSGDRGHGGD